MNVLIKKEIRLLLPVWGMVMVLTALSVHYMIDPMGLYIAFVGMAILAVASFGREIVSGTFSNLLAQPADRSVIWRTKTRVLVLALTAVVGELLIGRRLVSPEAALDNAWLLVVSVPVAIAGGYWMVLLLRQVVAALWLAILVPTSLCIGALALADHYRVSDAAHTAAVSTLLILYSVVGIWCSWRLYRRAQDVQWTGGVVAADRWLLFHGANGLPVKIRRGYQPFVALLRKELQLQQVTLLGMAGLFILHFGAISLRRFTYWAESASWKDLEFTLTYFGLLWLLVPFFTAGASIAEEYKLGTREGLLCLPVKGNRQFAGKLICTMLIGGLLTALLLWSVEEIGFVSGVRHGLVRVVVETIFPAPGVPLGHGSFIDRLELNDMTFAVPSLVKLGAIFAGISAMALFVASLARNILQTLLLGGLFSVVVYAGFTRLTFYNAGYGLGIGPLVICFAIPLLFVGFLYRAYQNFRPWPGVARLWFGNGLVMSGAVALAGILGSAIYYRVWEIVLPATAHGPAKLTITAPPHFSFYHSTPRTLSLLFGDGRLWVGCWSEDEDSRSSQAPIVLGRHRFVEGSNWTSIAQGYRTLVGTQKDGTLWFAEATKQRSPSRWHGGSPVDEKHFEMTRLGNDSDWAIVEPGDSPFSFILLKRNGTLWSLGPNDMDLPLDKYYDFWPGIQSFLPSHLGPEQKWTGMFFNNWRRRFLKDENGAFWMVDWWDASGTSMTPVRRRAAARRPQQGDWATLVDRSMQREFAPNCWIYRVRPEWASIPWKSPTGVYGFYLGVREDGTLWGWGRLPLAMDRTGSMWTSTPIQIGRETNWRVVQNCAGGCMLLKADGTLWVWSYGSPVGRDSWRRLDRNTDWVGLGDIWGCVIALAADGGLWRWTPDEFERYSGGFGVIPTFELAPSTKPEFVGNIFDKQAPNRAAVKASD